MYVLNKAFVSFTFLEEGERLRWSQGQRESIQEVKRMRAQ